MSRVSLLATPASELYTNNTIRCAVHLSKSLRERRTCAIQVSTSRPLGNVLCINIWRETESAFPPARIPLRTCPRQWYRSINQSCTSSCASTIVSPQNNPSLHCFRAHHAYSEPLYICREREREHSLQREYLFVYLPRAVVSIMRSRFGLRSAADARWPKTAIPGAGLGWAGLG